jgi:hypothetical protein
VPSLFSTVLSLLSIFKREQRIQKIPLKNIEIKIKQIPNRPKNPDSNQLDRKMLWTTYPVSVIPAVGPMPTPIKGLLRIISQAVKYVFNLVCIVIKDDPLYAISWLRESTVVASKLFCKDINIMNNADNIITINMLLNAFLLNKIHTINDERNATIPVIETESKRPKSIKKVHAHE